MKAHPTLEPNGFLTLYNRVGTEEYILSHRSPEESNQWKAIEKFPAFKNTSRARKSRIK